MPKRLKGIVLGLSYSTYSAKFPSVFNISRKQNNLITIQQHIASMCNYTFHVSIQSIVYI